MTTTFRARFDGKVLVPEGAVDLPVGEVIECQATPVNSEQEETPLMRLAKIADQFPANPDSPGDRAAQHDHYLYGLPKKP